MIERCVPLPIQAVLIGTLLASGLAAQPFRAGFESGKVDEVHSIHTDKGGAVTVVPNPQKDKINPTDRVVKFLTTGAIPERAEIRVKGIDELGEYWYGWQVLLPADWQPARRLDQGGGHDIITQWHRGGRTPRWARGHPMTISTDDAGNYHISWNYGGPDRVEKGARLQGINAFTDRGKWTNWAFHVRWAKDDTPGAGFMRLYHNGKRVFADEGPNHENLASWMMWKAGIYHGNPSKLPTDPYVIYGDTYIMTGPEGSLQGVNPYLAAKAQSEPVRRRVTEGIVMEEGVCYGGGANGERTLVIAYPEKMNDAPGRMDHGRPDSPESQFIGGPIQDRREHVEKANPIRYVDPSDPPILILHGRNDMSVPFNQSELFLEALRQAGVTAKLVPVENAGHGFKPDPKGARIEPDKTEINRLQRAWFKKHLRQDPPTP